MIRFAIALAVIAMPAYGRIVAEAPATNGGNFYLTDVKDNCPGESRGYAVSGFANQGLTDYGCWIKSGNSIVYQSSLTGITFRSLIHKRSDG